MRQIATAVLDAFKGINGQVDNYIQRGSGWVIQAINALDVHITHFKPIRGATYLPLPTNLRHRKAIINVRNSDNKCFMWSILAALHPVESYRNPQRPYHYTKFVSTLNFDGITFPVQVLQIQLFEMRNNLSINLYGCSSEERRVKVLHLAENHRVIQLISLFLYNQQHYCWIRDVERF